MEIAVRVLLFLGGLIFLTTWEKTDEVPGGYVFFRRLSHKARVVIVVAFAIGGLQLIGVEIGTSYTIFGGSLGLLIFSVGVALAVWGKLTLGSNWDFRKESRPLITWRAYRLCRHPIYLGGFLAAVGAEIALGSIFAFLAIPGFFVLRAAAISEERLLADHFGEEYRDYQRRVRRFIVF